MKKLLVAAAVLVMVGSAMYASAGPGRGCDKCGQGPGGGCGGRYDATKTETIVGQVVSVDPVTSPRGGGRGIALKVLTGGGNVVAHLGPQWYFDQQQITFAAGDAVEVTGAKVFRHGEEIFVAGSIKKGSEVIKLRDEQGVPVWAGWKRGASKS